ncbi:ACH1-like protein [Mya arenaria]|uniref:ACH1-like protein n=1 Tax=Mya arenaria TaxID=6604 RepID=A0ABY7DR85_MYAAR|nr:acetylcholine receptor subunit alpha-like [Mya arenaria]WAR00213.1 ACH1-like protein [Mya arenaria]
MFRVIHCFLFLLSTGQCLAGADIQTMKSLFNDTLYDYDTRIRPIDDQTDAVYVNTRFTPQSLLEFDTSEQKFSMLGYFNIHWTDEVMRWAPGSYGGADSIKVPVDQVWTPGLIINKAYDGHGVIGGDADLVKIENTGAVQWIPEGIYSVVCDVDIQYYPFDEQVCTLTYYVSDETIRTVVLDHYLNVDMSEYSENSAWTIASVTKSRYLLYNTYFIDIEFRLQRRANFTTFTLIMPLLMLAFLNICIFLVPIGSGEKGSFSITIFLSYGIFVTIISDTLPHNSLQVSFFVLFIVILLILSVISVFYTIIQAKLVSSIGDKECPWTCLKSKKKKVNTNDDDVENFESDKEKEFLGEQNEKSEKSGFYDDNADDELYTWSMFLEKLDTYIFALFFVLIVVTTAVFFSMLLSHATGATDSQSSPPPTTATP